MKVDEDNKESRKRVKRRYAILSLQRFSSAGESKCKGKEWIDQEYFEEISRLFKKYSKHHSAIVKASKLSKSPYQRLMKVIKIH